MATRELFACQGCNGGKRVMDRCPSCNIFICEDCRALHLMCALNLSDEQKHVGLNDEAAGLLINREIKCDFHNLPYCGFCRVCEVFVCTVCIPQHNGHTLSEMDIGVQFSAHKLKSFKSQLEQDITTLFRDQSKLESLRTTEKSKYVTEKRNIRRQGEIIKQAIDNRVQVLLRELDKCWDLLDKCIKEEENNIQKNGTELEENRTIIGQVLETNDIAAVLGSLKVASSYVGPKHIHSNFQPLPEFVPGSFTQCIIESIHGTLLRRNQNTPVDIDIKATEHYETDLPSVNNIVCCPDGSQLINSKSKDLNSGELQQVVLFNNTVKTKEKFLIDFASMALLPSGELLVSVKESNLKVLSNATGKLLDKYSVAPFQTTEALHVTKDNKIIMGTTERHSTGKRKIVLMNITGEQEMEYALDNNNKQLFQDTTPFKVTSDSDNIYVLDKSQYKYQNGRLVVIKRNGGVKSIYNASKTSKYSGSFVPKDLTITRSGHVIVCDKTTLHILNTEGQCVKYHEIGLDLKVTEPPLCIDVDLRGMLLMGCKDKNKTNAKIHVFQLNGC